MTVLPIPAPMMDTPFVTVNRLPHVAGPAGTIIVSPYVAEETAFLTSTREGLAAVTVPGCLMLIVLLALFELEPALTVRVTW